MAATGDRVPCVYVENRRVVGLDPADPIAVSYARPVGDVADRQGASRAAQDAPEPRPRQDDRQRHQPHRLHDRRQGGALEGRGHGRASSPARAVAFIEQHEATPVLPLLRHARHPRAARAASALRRRTTGAGPARRRDRAARLGGRRGPRQRSIASGSPTRRSSSSRATTARWSTTATQTRRSRSSATHRPAGPFRGGKYSSFEGGTRVPFSSAGRRA